MTADLRHIPVMPDEVKQALAIRAGGVAVDATLGLGGHALMMAQALGERGWLIGIDQDEGAIALARARLAGFSGRLDIVHANFRRLGEVLQERNIEAVDAVLFDLGVSSLQLDDAARGFSFRADGPLDMRMDAGDSALPTAEELVNGLPEKDLAEVIYRLGEERFARRIARNICAARAGQRIVATQQLAAIVLRSLPKGYERGRLHPATRTFQALRIAVNRELEVLSDALAQAFVSLKPGGRMAVIAFHSLEDRIVKEQFKALAREGRAGLITKKPLVPTEAETAANPRSRSAKLRVIERMM